jgi:hypothetical protein
MRKIIFLISLLVLAIFIAGCKEQAGEAINKYAAQTPAAPLRVVTPVATVLKVCAASNVTVCANATYTSTNWTYVNCTKEVRLSACPAKMFCNAGVCTTPTAPPSDRTRPPVTTPSS